jgi:hypothetical protein
VNWRVDITKAARAAGLTRPDQLLVVSGAGVSQEHPTHAPSGVELMRSAMDGFFLPGTLREMGDAYAAIRVASGLPQRTFWGRPRLEAVLDVVNDVYGSQALGYLTRYFTDRPSNRVHAMLAAHLDQGGRQLTANFDLFIEHAATTDNPDIHHFHGSVESRSDALPFGARLAAIERGFDAAGRARVLAPLIDPATRCVAFVGYSFSDYFDATPAIVEAIADGLLDGKTLIWFDFDPGLPEPLTTVPDLTNAPEVISAAAARGVAVIVIKGWSGDALFELLRASGCRLDSAWTTPDLCDSTDVSAPRRYPAGRMHRKAATVQLLGRFGMLGRLPSPQLELEVADIPVKSLADYWWKKGRYEQARDAALAAIPARDPHRRLRRLLAHARYDWIEGRLAKAGRRTLAAINALDAEHDDLTALRIESLERYGRVAVHARRSPDARVFVLPGLLQRLPDYERRVKDLLRLPEVSGTPAAHLEDALRNYQTEVRGRRPASDSATATHRAALVERFRQSEAIDAYVDYIRGNANRGVWELPRDRTQWREAMVGLYTAVGNEADIRRLILFEPRGFGAGKGQASPFDAARRLDASHYHRARMIARHLMMRVVRTPEAVRSRRAS